MMLNRATITSDVKYLFDNIKSFDCEKCIDFIKNNNVDLPDEVQEEVEKMYYQVLLGNEKISIADQIQIVSNNYQILKKYIEENYKDDQILKARIFLMDIEIPNMTKFISGRENIRTLRRGYK